MRWILLNGVLLNVFHIATVKIQRSDTATDNYILQVSMSNGLVFEQFFPSEASATSMLTEITGIKSDETQ
jgi:hypothetical protein